MSCISRAMRARSAAAARRPCWSRSYSSRAARSCRRRQRGPAVTDVDAQDRRRRGHARQADERLLPVRRRPSVRWRGRRPISTTAGGHERGAQRLRGRDGVERHQQRAVAEGPDVGEPLDQRDGGDHREDADRVPTTDEQRQRQRDGEQPGRRGRRDGAGRPAFRWPRSPRRSRCPAATVATRPASRDGAIADPGSCSRPSRYPCPAACVAIRRRVAAARRRPRRPPAPRSRRTRAKPPHGER